MGAVCTTGVQCENASCKPLDVHFDRSLDACTRDVERALRNHPCNSQNADYVADLLASMTPEEQKAEEQVCKNLKLLTAAGEGQTELIRTLLREGAFIETRRRSCRHGPIHPETAIASCVHGLNPLMYAAQGGHWQACEELLAWKASPHAQDEDGTSPLHFAAQGASRDACAVLLAAGAHRSSRDYEGYTPLDYVPLDEASSSSDSLFWRELLGTKGPATNEMVVNISKEAANRAAVSTEACANPAPPPDLAALLGEPVLEETVLPAQLQAKHGMLVVAKATLPRGAMSM